MNTVTCTREMTAPQNGSRRGFTLIEMLMVIAIIAIVAGLVVGLVAVATATKRLSRAKAERDRLVLLIESYKSKLGVYPPGNPNPNNPHMNTLFYELAGAIRDTNRTAANPTYITPFAPDIQGSVLNSSFGVNGIQNAVDILGETNQVHQLLKDIHPDQTNQISGGVSLVVPIDGPNGRPNPWNYLVGENAVHNKESFDLWVDIIVRGKTNRIGNWKD